MSEKDYMHFVTIVTNISVHNTIHGPHTFTPCRFFPHTQHGFLAEIAYLCGLNQSFEQNKQ